jgi:hypothetical protein
MVLVFIWLAKPSNLNVGHGSMRIIDPGKGGKYGDKYLDEYVSNWPGDGSWWWLVYGKGKAQESLQEDVQAEGGLPDFIYKIDGLDEMAMARRWAVLRKDLKYSMAFYNCFTTIADVISAGLTTFWQQTLGDTFLDHKYVNVHTAMMLYLHQVQLAVDKKITLPSPGRATIRPGSKCPAPPADLSVPIPPVVTSPRAPG